MIAYNNFQATFTATPINAARTGIIHTPHGIVSTPNFIFCGTKASIKSLPAHQVKEAGAEIILANTYHLLIYPGAEHISKRGGLHTFMNWQGPMLTDSGGYQVFAMGHGSVSAEIKKGQGRTLPKSLLSISEEGVSFRSYYNGSHIFLSPEIATHTQQLLGADLFMQFDECTPFHIDKSYTKTAMQRSIRWGDRCIDAFKINDNETQAMYGIIQGGTFKDLRKESAERVLGQNFWGNAIGGSLGADKSQMHDVVAMSSEMLSSERALHLLGIGDIVDIFWGVRQGIDTFDCVHPTRIARHACAIVPASIHPKGRLNLKNKQYAEESLPIDTHCKQICCTHHTRAYIHYLFKAKELLGLYLLTLHNIAQMSRLMKEIQTALHRDREDYENRKAPSHFKRLESFWVSKHNAS